MVNNPLLKFLKSGGVIILILTLVGALCGFFYTRQFLVSYEASQTFFVKRQTSSPSNQFYTYDGYYSAQAAERFTDSLTGLLKSQEVLRLLLNKDETLMFLGETPVSRIVSKVKVRRLSPQLVNFSYRGRSLETVQRVVQDVAVGLSSLSRDLSRGGDEGLSLYFIDSQPQVVTRFQSYLLNVAVGGLLGAFISFVFLLIRGYYYSPKNG